VLFGLEGLKQFNGIAMRGSRWIFSKYATGKNAITLCDSFNLYAASLDTIADKLGMEKLPGFGVDHCIRDCEITYELVDFFQNFVNGEGGQLQLTLPATALDLWRRQFWTGPGWKAVFPSTLAAFSDAYYGGRTECLQIGDLGEGPWTMLDFNSAYTFVQSWVPLPTISTLSLGRFDLSKEGASHCRVRQRTYLPVLPVRHRGKLKFPNGEFTGTWTNNELRYGVEIGAVEIVEGYWTWGTHDAEPYLADFAKHFYKLRKSGDSPLFEKACKLIPNAVYGKFAQSNIIEDFDRETGDFHRVEGQWPLQTNYIWSAIITAEARIMLHRETVQRDAKYMDTDSGLVRGDFTHETDEALGAFSFEGIWERAVVYLPKVYMFADEILDNYSPNIKMKLKAKGVPAKEYKHVVNMKETVRHFQFDYMTHGRAEWERPPRIKEAIRRGLKPGKWIGTTKTMRGRYDKRYVFPDGTTLPWEYDGEIMRPPSI